MAEHQVVVALAPGFPAVPLEDPGESQHWSIYYSLSYTQRKEQAMESILLGLAVLACPVGMGLMMWMMGKGMMGGSGKNAQAEVDEMRVEQERLAGEVERLERERAGELTAR